MGTKKYAIQLRILHWFGAVIILVLLFLGLYMTNLEEGAANRGELYSLHKSLGVIAFLMVLWRLPVRWYSRLPEPISTLKPWEITFSHWVHIGLYLSMIGMTVSGILMSSFYPEAQGITVFSVITLPDITTKNAEMSQLFTGIHSTFAWALTVLLPLHFAGVVKHLVVDKPRRRVLQRMI